MEPHDRPSGLRRISPKVPRQGPAALHYRQKETKAAAGALNWRLREGPSMDAIGRKRWAIAEGYIPSESAFSDRALVSHETACILNAGDHDAQVRITIFFANREPVGPYRVSVQAR